MADTKPLIVLCDGTWCGREADTRSNIYHIAKMVGINIDDPTDSDEHLNDDGTAWYIHGVGLGSTFLDYVFNGVTGQEIASQCLAAYKFIVYNYTYPERRIWMFGLSRGAYMVRSLAGMINNCGIVKPIRNSDGSINRSETDLLCRQVYRIYRSDDPINAPRSPQSIRFRQNASWPLIGDEEPDAPKLLPPVKFIGVFDTVGGLGIPDFVGGVGLDWPRFHDQKVSTVVELVYHALSLHDRFYIFPPCLAKRKNHPDKPHNFGITQKWFPGVHYDLGRQRFRFLRLHGGTWLERLLARLGCVSREIHPNEVLADLVLKWMVEAVKENDPTGTVISTGQANLEVAAANERMVAATRQTGSGDVYQDVLAYAPFGTVAVNLLTSLWGTRWQTNQIYQLFFSLRDRLVADSTASVYSYSAPDPSITNSNGRTIQELADIGILRYPSRAYESWRVLRRLLRLP